MSAPVSVTAELIEPSSGATEDEEHLISSPKSVKDDSKFRIDLERLISFLFPSGYQHPLVAGRLIAFGFYGPLDDKLNLRSGRRGDRVVLDYELEEICLQLEREDIVSIYLHRKRDLGLLSSAEQESIIAQADAHLKRAKGKASLPRLTKPDIYAIFKQLPRDSNGLLSFHEMQRTIETWRNERIKQYKLVFPEMGGGSGPPDTRPHKTGPWEHPPPFKGLVSAAIAPKTLFIKKRGLTNADVVEEQNKLLTKYAFQITTAGETADPGITQNVRLLRDVEPSLGNYDPFLVDKKTGKRSKARWSSSTAFHLGGH